MELLKKTRVPSYKALDRYARMLGFGDIHTRIDPITGLHAIIAVHSTKLGPAIGGCRFYPYTHPELALKDALRLSYGMTLKAAVSGLPNGGAKAVIIKPKHEVKDRNAIFSAFGDFTQTLNGVYIAAVDVGTTVSDITTIAERTPFVTGIGEDPSPLTARGVFRGMQAAVQYKWGKNTCKGLHVAIQGAGRVGFNLAKQLIQDGATVTMSDTHAPTLQQAVEKLGVNTASSDQIESLDCDIYAPCAMGGTVSHNMILRCKAKIISGAANNQLAHHKNAHLLQERGILYLPDFVINAGGLIRVASMYSHQDTEKANKKIDEIYNTVLAILKRAEKTKETTMRVAETIAFERLR
ncbi:MAG TPA: Glu/Leu/Phe/Val dehydrogenase dimerization domain-containing protein [Coxiellaceae bacterium]|nr:Glu/Leu/Phe/Val dehydrogenase dimerization domain-containing protein [Coxiellaceae bacterium]